MTLVLNIEKLELTPISDVPEDMYTLRSPAPRRDLFYQLPLSDGRNPVAVFGNYLISEYERLRREGNFEEDEKLVIRAKAQRAIGDEGCLLLERIIRSQNIINGINQAVRRLSLPD